MEKFTRAAGRSNGVNFFFCSHCTGLSQHPVFSSQEYDRFYEETQRSEAVGFSSESVPESHLQRKILDARIKLQIMERIGLFEIVRGGRVLEIGPGEGTLLKQLADMGFEVRGVEPLDPYAEYGRRVLGLDVRTGFFGPGSEPEGSADLVVLDNVLEHVIEPSKFLQAVRRVLQPSGAIYVAVPAAEKPHAENANVAHLTLWSRRALFLALHEAGFVAVSTIAGRPVSDPREWIAVGQIDDGTDCPFRPVSSISIEERWEDELAEWGRRQRLVAARKARFGPLYPILQVLSRSLQRVGLRQ